MARQAAYMADPNAALAAAANIFAVVDRRPAIDSASDAGECGIARGEIEFRDVTFGYPSRPNQTVLDGYSLKVRMFVSTSHMRAPMPDHGLAR